MYEIEFFSYILSHIKMVSIPKVIRILWTIWGQENYLKVLIFCYRPSEKEASPPSTTSAQPQNSTSLAAMCSPKCGGKSPPPIPHTAITRIFSTHCSLLFLDIYYFQSIDVLILVRMGSSLKLFQKKFRFIPKSNPILFSKACLVIWFWVLNTLDKLIRDFSERWQGERCWWSC